MNRLILCIVTLWVVAAVQTVSLAGNPIANKKEKKTFYDKVYALCIGVDEQKRSDLFKSLQFAGDDAQAVHAMFRDRYGYESELLVGKDATRQAILEKISAVSRKVGPKDVLLVYFAGHGATVRPSDVLAHERRGYMIAYDTAYNFRKKPAASLDVINEQAVPMHEVVKLTMESKAKHVLLVLDCCFSGITANLNIISQDVEEAEDMEEGNLLAYSTRQVLTAGNGRQKSLEFPKLKHGLFTYHLLEQLREGGGIQSLTETFAGIQGKVMRTTRKRMTPQRRYLQSSDGDWIFIQKGLTDEQIAQYELADQDTPISEEELDSLTSRSASGGDEEIDPKEQAQFERYQARAAQGDEVAMVALQHCYENGIGVKRDPDMAFYWANEAYDYDRTESRVGSRVMAHSYEFGIGVLRDPEQAKAIREAAQLFEVVSQFGGNTQNLQKAEKGFEIANKIFSVFDFGANNKPAQIIKQVRKARAAAGEADADATRKALDKLKEAMDGLRRESKSDEKMTSEQVTAIGKLCDALAKGLKKASKFEKYGVFTKVNTALAELDPTLEKLAEMFQLEK